MSKTDNEYTRQGYAVISRKHNILARIDRPDWREYMALQHSPWDKGLRGMDWVRCLGRSAVGHYMGCYSKDRITVTGAGDKVINSLYVDFDYIPKEGDPGWTEKTLALREKVKQDPDQYRLGFEDALRHVKRLSIDCGDDAAFKNCIDRIEVETYMKVKK